MHLIIPYASSQSKGCSAAWQGLKLPHLQQLLKRLPATDADVGDGMSLSPPHERALATALGLSASDGRIPWAALQTLQQPALSRKAGAWGFITLCHWQVNTNHMVMNQLPLPGLTAAQSDEFLSAMRPYFEEDGIALHPDQPGRYLAQAPIFADIDTASLDRVVGHNLEHWMPSPAQAGSLLRLQNEMQMLLYRHPLNDAREAQDLPRVNSFWLSGTGALPSAYQKPSMEAQPVVVAELRTAALTENWGAWSQAWNKLDATLIKSMLNMAHQGQPLKLTLCGERASQSWRSKTVPAWHKLKNFFITNTLSQLFEQL